MRLPDEMLEEIRLGNDIVELVTAYVPLRQTGGSYKGLCPFHKEKSPSFSVMPDRQIFHCFGCGASGNAFSFVMRMENVGFYDAVTFLADRIHYALPERNASPHARAEAEKNARTREILQEIHVASARFFYDTLQSPEGAAAAAYLDAREVSAGIRRRFGLGFAGMGRAALFNHLLEAGFEQELIIKSGVALPSKNQGGGYYDRFSGRLMFPIFNTLGKIVGFGGRLLGDGEPKYLNSPETPLFSKSKNLYGVHLARKTGSKTFLLVEGYMDVIALHQAGFTNAVAALGTAFNREHAALMRRQRADTAIIAFDSDGAGVEAALRAIPVLTKEGLNVKVLALTGAKDPDEYIKKFGAEAFANLLETARGHVAFQVGLAKDGFDLSATEDKVRFTREAAKIVAALESRVERDAYARDVARDAGLSYEAVAAEVDALAEHTAEDGAPLLKRNASLIGLNKMPEKGVIEAKKSLLSLMVGDARVSRSARPHLAPEEMDDPVYTRLLQLLYEHLDSGGQFIPAAAPNHFDTVEEHQKAAEAFETRMILDEAAGLEKAVNDLLKTIKRAYIAKLWNEKLPGADENTLKELEKRRENAEKLYITILDG